MESAHRDKIVMKNSKILSRHRRFNSQKVNSIQVEILNNTATNDKVDTLQAVEGKPEILDKLR